jgi:hypothetical protein
MRPQIIAAVRVRLVVLPVVWVPSGTSTMTVVE